MIALTHRIGVDGKCQDCGTALIEHIPLTQEVFVEDRIGKIETTHGGERAYRVGEHDSNEGCVK